MAKALKARKITPFIWWQPTDPANPAAGVYERHKNIMSGKHDAYIRSWAKAAKAHGGPVIVRMFHEMNSNWFPWGIDKQFDNSPTTFNEGLEARGRDLPSGRRPERQVPLEPVQHRQRRLRGPSTRATSGSTTWA